MRPSLPIATLFALLLLGPPKALPQPGPGGCQNTVECCCLEGQKSCCETLKETNPERARKIEELANARKTASPNQLNQQIRQGKAPKNVTRVDAGKVPGEQPHVHFKDGAALNKDGTWKHGYRALTEAEKQWLHENGWTLPSS